MESIDMNLDSEGSSNEEITSQRVSKSSKLRRSCELCRSHKARCNPSEAFPDRCQRCTRDGKKCIFLAAKARPKRAKNSKARVAEMEQRLDGLMALLQSQGRVDQQSILTPAITPPPPAQTLDYPLLLDGTNSSGTFPNVLSQRQDILSNPHQFPLFSLPRLIGDNIGDVISKDIISYDLAEEYLQLYRTKNIYFPFVIISPHTSLDNLRRDKPFLLLSILCSAAGQSQTKLMKALDLELRENLSRRTMINGENSLDILQGLLVYIVWYHFYFEPQRQQIYQLTQMAVAMAIDLGIHKPTQSPTAPNFSAIDLITPLACEFKVSADDPEVKRTLLGCYVLTSSVCQSLRKPNNMKYSDYFGQCCSSFAQNPVADSDHLLQYFVRLQHFQEEVNAAFDYDSVHNLRQLDSGRIEFLLKSFKRQLTLFEESFPPETWENVQITTTFYALRIYLYEVGFHANPPPLSLQPTNSQSHAQNWYYSTVRTESLLSCLHASKVYLDRCLLLPPSAITSFTLPDFIRLIYGLLIVGSFACLSDFPHIQELANLHYYLDAFHQKTTELLKAGYVPECIVHLDKLFQESSMWHTKTIKDPTAIGKCLSYHPHLMFNQVLPNAVSRTLGISELFAGIDESIRDQMQQQQWEGFDMLNAWPAGTEMDAGVLLGDVGAPL